jgi:cytochrome c peroxidase
LKRWLIIFFLAAFILSGAVFLDGCKKTSITPRPTSLNFVVPPGFPQPTFNFNNNPLTEEAFQLGKKLFFDTRLSTNAITFGGPVYCASCHQPVAAFTTFEHDRSHGINFNHTLRNAPGLFNLAWYPYFNQDGSAPNLETVYRNHITNPIEMGETTSNIINKIKDDTAYKRMFRAAFGDEQMTEERMFKAITQFVINLVSANSKYDRVLKGQANFTAQEDAGYTFFRNNCNSCHREPLFTDFSFRNTGLSLDAALQDFGRMRVTGSHADSLKFRVPSLRNLEFTSYYGHDGRYSMMRMMVEHYRNGILQSSTLDPALKNGINMTDTDEDNLVAFLRTLSDSTFLNNPRFR